jgi:hypothetical protein
VALEDPTRARAALDRLRERDPRLATLVEPMLGVTLAPDAHQREREDQRHPLASRAQGGLPHAAGHGPRRRPARIREVLDGAGVEDWSVASTRRSWATRSPPTSPLMDAIRDWMAREVAGATVVPYMLPPSRTPRTFRDAFPDCVAYGFFPIAT